MRLRDAACALVAVLALQAAAQSTQPPSPDACERCGRIEAVRPATSRDQWTPLGTVSSGGLGAGANGTPSAVTMVQVGRDGSKQGTVLIGAAGGAAYGTRPSQLNVKRWEVVVRMDVGGTRVLTQNYEPMLHEGDRVRVMGTQLELIQ